MIKTSQLDNRVLSIKGQKIIAALFLVTGHLPETDPLRQKLRTLAVALADGSGEEGKVLTHTIGGLLEAAVLARLIAEHNARIIQSELKYFIEPLSSGDGAIAALFPGSLGDSHKGHFLEKKTDYRSMSFIPTKKDSNVSYKNESNKENKTKRQEKILSYINDRKSANVKDIASLFPDISEKTIQRELGALVAGGKITKRGNKRWSLYLAI